MKELIRLLGIPVSDSVQVTDITVAFHGLSPGWAFAIGFAVIAMTVWTYFRGSSRLPIWKKAGLAALRSLLFALIILMLMRPVLLLTVEGTIRRTLLVLIDASASMQIKDLRQDEADLKRAAIAKNLLDPARGLDQALPPDTSSFNQIARSDVVKAVFTNDRLQLLARLGKNYDLAPFTFGQSLQALSSGSTGAPGNQPPEDISTQGSSFLNGVAFDKPFTAIGDAVRSLLDLKRGQPLAGILLITDGGNNYGSQPLDAAALAQQDKVPLFIYGLGITSPKDIIVSEVLAPEVVFAREEAQATVLISSQSMKGRTAKLVLKLGDQVMDSRDITFGEDGQLSVPMKFMPTEQGSFQLEASIDPLPDEAVRDNNKASQRVRVIDGKIQVLYVEQKPRWEFRYLEAMLVRDRRLSPKFFLVDGDPALGQEADSPYLAEPPKTKDDWMKYDVIIIGDVDPHVFNAEQMQGISSLVSDFGGGLVFLAGKKFMPGAYGHSGFDSLFPVEFESALPGAHGDEGSSRADSLDLTLDGQNSSTIRLGDTDDQNLAIWKNLPGVYWTAAVTRAKPAAQVLLTDPAPEKATRAGAMPVVVLQSYGAGQSLFVGTDETWRWRRNVGEKYYTRFWGQILMRLGLPRLLGASKLTQLTTDRKSYVSGERVVISGRIYRSGFEPISDPTVAGTVTIKPDQSGASDIKQDVSLQATTGKPGNYEGEFVVTTPGIYTFSTANDPTSALDFRVSEPRFEFGETALNLPLLQKMADTSGGLLFREENLAKFPDALGVKSEKVPSPMEVELLFSPFYFGLMIFLASLEWLLRKLWQLA